MSLIDLSLVASLVGTALLPAGGPTVEDELRDLETRLSEAVVRGDAAFVDRVWDEDFFYTGVRGEVKRKADILNELKAGDLKFEVLKFDDVRVAPYGDVAVVNGRATAKGRNSKGLVVGEFRYTRVWVKRADGWKIVAFQGTPIVVK
jgi:ketosteroid isomerase-like protein